MNEYKFLVQTQYPIAFDSIDHTRPEGVINDNYSKMEFIEDVEQFFPQKPLQVMDLGCAGGLLVHDFLRRGHRAIGLEGSCWNIHLQRHEWPVLFNRNLFTCDISRDFQVFVLEDAEQSPLSCDLITAWEVVEHIPPVRLKTFFANVRKHLKIGGKFLATISTVSDHSGHHVSVFPAEHWKKVLLPEYPGFQIQDYPFPTERAVRNYDNSAYVMLERVS